MVEQSKFETVRFGHTSLGLPIEAWRWVTPGAPELLVLGGVHGDEVEGVICAFGLIDRLRGGLPWRASLTIVPTFNLDGVLATRRTNGNGVDLNRNLPSNDWNPKAFNDRYPPGPFACSEPENQALVNWLKAWPAQFIVSLHSFSKFLLNINGDCQQEAEAMARVNHYPIEPSMGYPTPGCLGTYAGIERQMPTITYELHRGMKTEEILKVHVDAVLAGLAVAAKKGNVSGDAG